MKIFPKTNDKIVTIEHQALIDSIFLTNKSIPYGNHKKITALIQK